MKVTRNIYIRNSSKCLKREEIADELFFYGDVDEEVKPKTWIEIKDFTINPEGKLEIDIPDSLIDDIIYANTKEDIDKKIAKHLASITQLEDFRSKGK